MSCRVHKATLKHWSSTKNHIFVFSEHKWCMRLSLPLTVLLFFPSEFLKRVSSLRGQFGPHLSWVIRIPITTDVWLKSSCVPVQNDTLWDKLKENLTFQLFTLTLFSYKVNTRKSNRVGDHNKWRRTKYMAKRVTNELRHHGCSVLLTTV